MNKNLVPRWSKGHSLKIFVAIVLTAGGALLLEAGIDDWSSGGAESGRTATAERTVFANCLNERGAMMYGVDTCSFCLAQKKMFGDDFREIKYINCDFDREFCQKKRISRFPAWEIQGNTFYGMQSFEQLSMQSGCPSPNQSQQINKINKQP